jgi:hypothetical protein
MVTGVNMVSSRGREYISSALIVSIGAVAVFAGRSYRVGSITDMGAGFVPTAIGISLIVVGLLIGATTNPRFQLAASTGKSGRGLFDARAWSFIVGGVAAFVLLGAYGFVPASFACVFISTLADRRNSIRDASLLAAAIVAVGYLIFHVGLKIQLAAFAWG